jgi:hypothetical protein
MFSGFAVADQTLPDPVSLNGVTTLSFNGYAPTGSNDGGVYLTEAGTLADGVGITNAGSTDEWILDARGIAGSSALFYIPGTYDEAVFFEIVIDAPDSLVYAEYNVGGGLQTTPSYTITGDLSLLTRVQVFDDYRSPRLYSEIDNIVVADSTPEPSSWLLLAAISAGLMVCRRGRARPIRQPKSPQL